MYTGTTATGSPKKEIYERDVEPMGNQKDPVDIMKWAICKQVNLMEGRPIIE